MPGKAIRPFVGKDSAPLPGIPVGRHRCAFCGKLGVVDFQRFADGGVLVKHRGGAKCGTAPAWGVK